MKNNIYRYNSGCIEVTNNLMKNSFLLKNHQSLTLYDIDIIYSKFKKI